VPAASVLLFLVLVLAASAAFLSMRPLVTRDEHVHPHLLRQALLQPSASRRGRIWTCTGTMVRCACGAIRAGLILAMRAAHRARKHLRMRAWFVSAHPWFQPEAAVPFAATRFPALYDHRNFDWTHRCKKGGRPRKLNARDALSLTLSWLRQNDGSSIQCLSFTEERRAEWCWRSIEGK
jgi:hypothetical protein